MQDILCLYLLVRIKIINYTIEIKELHERQRNMSELAGNLKLRLDSYRRRCATSSAIGPHRSSVSRSGSSVASVAHSRNTTGPSDLSANVVDGLRMESIHESSPSLSMRTISVAQTNRQIGSVDANSPVARLRRTPQHSVQVSN